MTDTLRAKIAAVLMGYYYDEPLADEEVAEAYEAADAVIAALGLDRQCHYDPDCPYYRYVTEWIPDD